MTSIELFFKHDKAPLVPQTTLHNCFNSLSSTSHLYMKSLEFHFSVLFFIQVVDTRQMLWCFQHGKKSRIQHTSK